MINIRKDIGIKIPPFKEILNPQVIYLPLDNNKPKRIEKVFIGNNIDNNICSISGSIKCLAKGKDKNYLVIENNYLEKYIPYNKKLDIKDILYINCLDKDPYSYNNYYILLNEKDIIISICSYLLDNGCQKIVLVMPSYFIKQISIYNEYLNNKILLKIIDEYYPLGYSSILSKSLNINEDYIISLEDFLKYYYFNMKSIYKDYKYITINGNIESIVLKVKLNTIINDYLPKDNIILNNSLNGKIINKTDIITEDTDTLIYLDTKYKEKKCLNCGLCLRICPSKDKCIRCGLCKYVCPSRIE